MGGLTPRKRNTMEEPKNEALVISTYMIEADIFQPIATRVLPATNTRPERIAVTAGMGVRRVYTRWELKVPPVGLAVSRKIGVYVQLATELAT